MTDYVTQDEFGRLVERMDHRFDSQDTKLDNMSKDTQAVREEVAAMRGAADERNRMITILLTCLTIAVAIGAALQASHALYTGEIKIPSISLPNSIEPIFNARTRPHPAASSDDLDRDDTHPNDPVNQ